MESSLSLLLSFLSFFDELMGVCTAMDWVLRTECFLEGDLEGDLKMGAFLSGVNLDGIGVTAFTTEMEP